MGFLDAFAGKPKRFVTQEELRANMARQMQHNARTLGRLADKGISYEDLFRLEFFFYADSTRKAGALASELDALGYEVECRPSPTDERQTLITGWTTPMPMAEAAVNGWSMHMCQLGFRHDCRFEGWGST
jgi:hypothetical protein